MTTPPNITEVAERLRDNALYIEGWEPPTDFRVSVRIDDLRIILAARSERPAVESDVREPLRAIADIWLHHKAGEFDAAAAVGKMVDVAHEALTAIGKLDREGKR